MMYLDYLPIVKTYCFCCFLREGTMIIAVSSFILGLIFAPNIAADTHGYWKMKPVLSHYSELTETMVQMTLGIVSILLCVMSAILFIGALYHAPLLIELYQWGIVVYASTVSLMFSILACLCFITNRSCYISGLILCVIMFVVILLSSYFLVVTNSLKISLKVQERTNNNTIINF